MNHFLKFSLGVTLTVFVLTGCMSKGIDREEAVKTALKHAGLTENQITVVKNEKEIENGKSVYEIEFYTDDFQEYDYMIDGKNGTVISYDTDFKNPPAKEPTASFEPFISEEEIKAKVLERVPGATIENIREFRSEREDGRMVYEGEILLGEKKYEFEVDASNGEIISWDEESIFD